MAGKSSDDSTFQNKRDGRSVTPFDQNASLVVDFGRCTSENVTYRVAAKNAKSAAAGDINRRSSSLGQ
jgi:hypothetical protein